VKGRKVWGVGKSASPKVGVQFKRQWSLQEIGPTKTNTWWGKKKHPGKGGGWPVKEKGLSTEVFEKKKGGDQERLEVSGGGWRRKRG